MNTDQMILRIPQLPDDLNFDEKMEWFMERFGKAIGLELAYRAFALINNHQDKLTPLDELVFTLEIKCQY